MKTICEVARFLKLHHEIANIPVVKAFGIIAKAAQLIAQTPSFHIISDDITQGTQVCT